MADNLIAPVKLLIKAIDNGIDLTTTVIENSSSATAGKALQINETIPGVQKSLKQCSQAIQSTYRECVVVCGEPFSKALVEDKKTQKRLKEFKHEVTDKKDECEECEEEPEAYDPAAFLVLQDEVQKVTTECISIFHRVRDQCVQANPPPPQADEQPKDDRAQLASMRQRPPSLRKPVPPPPTSRPSPIPATLQIATPPEPTKPKSPWAIDGPAQFDMGRPASAILGPPRKESVRDVSPMSPTTSADGLPRLIPRDVVHFRLNANDEFLARRRQSRIIFQNELRKSVSSIGSIEENTASEVFNDGALITSPILGSSGISTSPIDGRSSRASNGYPDLVTRQRSLGQASQGTRSSRTSSILQDTRQTAQRQDSQDSIFGNRAAAPLSPPLSEHRTSGGMDSWGGGLATTLKVPGFGSGVEDGIEVVAAVDYDTEKIAVIQEQTVPTPTASMKSIDYPMRHDSSFYKFGGFCEGARNMIRGETGFKVVKRPSGHYSATVSARCVKCSYEVGWNDVEKDRLLERTGIYGNSGIRWRQKFISKCHLRTNSIDASVYACIFCIEEHRTIEEHDATVFFSVPQLFRHLATHPRPLPNISGIEVIYGSQLPSVLDFDLHFTMAEPAHHRYNMRELAPKVAARPSANALVTHHPKNTTSHALDPDGEPVLHFAAGARIIGITFPERFHGTWCIGYHDGLRGAFPASTVMLDMPAKEDVRMSSQSTLVATARWDFKPKDAKEGGWLKFSKGETILSIGYTFQDQWCYSGQTSKGKWGLFPAAFVEGLHDVGNGRFGSYSPSNNVGVGLSSSSGSVKGGGFKLGGLGGRMPSLSMGRMGIGRNKSKRDERRESFASAGSSGSGGQSAGIVVKGGQGVEVVASPIHGSSGGWRR